MGISSIMDRFRQKADEKASDASARYRALVVATADNADVDADDALAVLEVAGKSPDDLARDAELLVNRRQWAVDAAKLPAVEAECRVYEREKAAAQAAWEAACKAREQAVRDFSERSLQLQSRQTRAMRAGQKLLQTCNTTINDSIAAASVKLRRIHEEIGGTEANGYATAESKIQELEGSLANFAGQVRDLPPGASAVQREKLETVE